MSAIDQPDLLFFDTFSHDTSEVSNSPDWTSIAFTWILVINPWFCFPGAELRSSAVSKISVCEGNTNYSAGGPSRGRFSWWSETWGNESYKVPYRFFRERLKQTWCVDFWGARQFRLLSEWTNSHGVWRQLGTATDTNWRACVTR